MPQTSAFATIFDDMDGGEGQWTSRVPTEEVHDAAIDVPRGFEIVRRHEVFGDLDLTSGVCVTLIGGDFFRMKYLLRNTRTNALRLYGWYLTPNWKVNKWLPKKAAEVCWIGNALETDKRQDKERCLEKIAFEAIDFGADNCIRKIIFTNQKREHFNDVARFNGDTRAIWREGTLFCRVKHIELYPESQNTRSCRNKSSRPSIEHVLQWLQKEEADEGYGISDEERILSFVGDRGAKPYTGKSGLVSANDFPQQNSWRRNKRRRNLDSELQEIEELEFQAAMRLHGHFRLRPSQYTAADICCCAGGASGGIEETPFRLVFGLDKDLASAKAWSLNWPAAAMYCMDMSDFCKHDHVSTSAYAHAMHISFSCKAWSWANPYKGEDVDMIDFNPDDVAATLAATSLLPRLRPRLVTFENTDGLERMDIHEGYFNCFIHSIAGLGYSVRWKICDLADYGSPQHRRRFIAIASCPGEELPKFPPPTHGVRDGLQPFTTVDQAIRCIDENDPLHNPKALRNAWRLTQQKKQKKNMQPAQKGHILRRGFTTQGPSEYHYDRDREFSIRECMDLMGFRRSHKLPLDLCRGKMIEMIGNAVPRHLIRLIYQDFHKVLQRTDEKIEKWLINTHKEAKRSARPLKRARTAPADSVTIDDSDGETLANVPPPRCPRIQQTYPQQHTISGAFPIGRAAVHQQETMKKEEKPIWIGNCMDLT